METTEQQATFNDLAASRARFLDLIEGVDLNRWVNETTGRRVKDVIAHLAHWETSASLSLEAFAAGGAFRLTQPLLIDDANQRIFEANRDLDAQSILTFHGDSRDRLVAAAKAIPLASWPGPVVYPWGAEGGVAELVIDMQTHEGTHTSQIQAALEPGRG